MKVVSYDKNRAYPFLVYVAGREYIVMAGSSDEAMAIAGEKWGAVPDDVEEIEE